MVQSSSSGDRDLTSSNAAFIFRDLPVGARVKLIPESPWNGAVAEITGNPRDGAWLLVRFVEYPGDHSRVGQEDMVFFQYVEAVV